MEKDFDVLIIGSGFGGSVSAMRLVEKGYQVGVIEAGKRFNDGDFPKSSWQLRKFLYAPRLGFNGIQRIHLLPDTIVLCGAGVGGGSLVYANTLYVPPKSYFQDRQWSAITDWERELAPWYDQAKRMLGVTKNPAMSPADVVMKSVADDMGVGATFTLAPLGIYFGEGAAKISPDPFFGGVGPAREGCRSCGACMTGCRHNAKNTLPKNYLGLAESHGAQVIPERTVTKIKKLHHGWMIETRKSSALFGGRKRFFADEVIVAAGAYNSQKLLHTMKAKGILPKLSETLGKLSRTNSESLNGAIASRVKKEDRDFSYGPAISSSFFPEEHTHVEPVRYGKGSNAMGLLQTIMTDGALAKSRGAQWFSVMRKKPVELIRTLNVHKWSQRSIIALVMQDVDTSIRVKLKRTFFRYRLTSENDSINPNSTHIPVANEVAQRMAEKIGGVARGNVGDLIGAPMTAHFVGGCVIGDSDQTGVIDPYHRVWNYPTLHVVDGSALTANLGVNPSLTITAQAERAISMWPNKGEADMRPEQGREYREIGAVKPCRPIVPAGAPAALR